MAASGADVLGNQLDQRSGDELKTRVAATDVVTFYWGLKRRDGAVANKLKSVANPKSKQYRKFLTPKQIATRYGASKSTVRTVKAYLRSKGVVGDVDSSRTFMRVRGSVGQFETAFNTTIVSGTNPSAGFMFYGAVADPAVPADIASLAPQRVWAYVKQTATGAGSSIPARRTLSDSLVRARSELQASQRVQTSPPTNQGTLVGTCAAVKTSPVAKYTMTVQQGAVAYKINKLQKRTRGDRRTKQPLIGVLGLGQGYTNSKLKSAASCVGVRAPAQRYRTDGMTGPLPDGLEGNLDIQLVTAAIQGISKVPVFEVLGSQLSSFLGPFAALNSPQRPTVLTNSYLLCEPEANAELRSLTDSAYSRLALAGTSAFIAAGDSGSSGCVDHDTGVGPTNLAVGYPASSPFTTGVGGTRLTLRKNNSIASEVVWNDSPWGVLAGGNGGTSVDYQRPWWQPKSVTKSTMLTVPDISAHSSTFPGFPVVGASPGLFEDPVYGTSAAAPLMASGFALLNAREMSKGQPPLGFVNPWLYQQRYSVIRDVKVGNNAVFNPACCVATKGYDKASGLGSPNFAKLAQRVKAPR